jgi:hypothetical protein
VLPTLGKKKTGTMAKMSSDFFRIFVSLNKEEKSLFILLTAQQQ